ncbi:MAG: hypothetical protein Ct9H300mP28_23420 [Pseudomonadota bacterium]|nr:MAG: hypothetical protein Ct9H300mP28_23420 [Pseudomonadota bacterium]
MEESLEKNLIESPVSDEQTKMKQIVLLNHLLTALGLITGVVAKKFHDQTDSKLRTIVSSLKNHPLFEGDVLSKDLSTAALILTFKPGSNPESDSTQNILKELLTKHHTDSQIRDKLQMAYAGQPRQINKAGG